MFFKGEMSQILPRKIMSATITGSLFAILLGLLVPNPFGEGIPSVSEYFQAFFVSVLVYLMNSFPVILLYATITSTLSDYIAHFMTIVYMMEMFR